MYTPSSFEVTDVDRLHDFIQQHSFGILVSNGNDQIDASHLPFLLDRQSGLQGMLVGHMAKANSQWHCADAKVTVIFNGPHAYISPKWYGEQNVVPTWNYVAVHVYGTLRLVEDSSKLTDLLRSTVDYYEADLDKSSQQHSSPWTLDQPEPEFLGRLVESIVGFEIEIDRIEGIWKLNQNHERRRRERVVEALQEAGGVERLRIAELMSAALNA